mmetsp:Transcript_23359/g.43932  ORF Transcript_23359/g.43932 Transcript_23359/m.43932 type:complete len:574 (+) Transcript_23359:65-1786(+)
MAFQPPPRASGKKAVVLYASAPPYQPVTHGVRLLRSPVISPQVAHVRKAPVLIRYSTTGVGYPQTVEEPVPGLALFLQALDMQSSYQAAKRWSQDQGACELLELVENAEDLATALDLQPAKRAQLKSSGGLARQIAQIIQNKPQVAKAPSLGTLGAVGALGKAMSTPVTQKEAAHIRVAPQQLAVHPAPLGRTETDLWDEREAVAMAAVGPEGDAIEPALRHRPEPPRWCTPPKHRWRTDDAILRQRIPTDAEIKVREHTLAEVKAEELAEWGPEKEFQTKAEASRATAKSNKFEQMRGEFLERHGPSIQQELGPGYKLVPADVGPAVKEKFLEACETFPDFGYHGTRAANIPSILTQGLKVPGAASGVRVANGSAHGVGIYTGMPGNSWLSKGFSDTRDMLVCGVVDPDAPAPPPAVAQAAATAAAPRIVGGHRNHHKPAASQKQVLNLVPRPNYVIQTQRENDAIKVVGGARVIFKEERVAPLFVAQPAESKHTYERALSSNSKSERPDRGGSKGQVYIPQTGEVVWDCWEEYRCWNARRVKRILVTKERQQQRAAARLVKEEKHAVPCEE